ncbi:hypothetical protein OIU84_020278 [Salix udensis]|uniref:Uncharacterized protein n=1 Tax=Salix udensis TaxID=889485 RepID=A0AAD6J829_9ROSI|nr:hypothetical protein OIU84_020278 [Salix udensis]
MQWIPLRKLARPVTAHVQLWLEKLGAKEPFSRNVAICRTIAREEEALGRYKLTAGNIVLFPKFKVHGTHIAFQNPLNTCISVKSVLEPKSQVSLAASDGFFSA